MEQVGVGLIYGCKHSLLFFGQWRQFYIRFFRRTGQPSRFIYSFIAQRTWQDLLRNDTKRSRVVRTQPTAESDERIGQGRQGKVLGYRFCLELRPAGLFDDDTEHGLALQRYGYDTAERQLGIRSIGQRLAAMVLGAGN